MYCKFFYYWITFFMNIHPKIKFLLHNCINRMSSCEVLPQFTYRYIKIKILILMKYSCHEMNKKTIRSILIRSQLYLHRSKLYPPTNLIINRYFESNRIPISTIKHLKHIIFLLTHSLKTSMTYKIVSFE